MLSLYFIYTIKKSYNIICIRIRNDVWSIPKLKLFVLQLYIYIPILNYITISYYVYAFIIPNNQYEYQNI